MVQRPSYLTESTSRGHTCPKKPRKGADGGCEHEVPVCRVFTRHQCLHCFQARLDFLSFILDYVLVPYEASAPKARSYSTLEIMVPILSFGSIPQELVVCIRHGTPCFIGVRSLWIYGF